MFGVPREGKEVRLQSDAMRKVRLIILTTAQRSLYNDKRKVSNKTLHDDRGSTTPQAKFR